MAHMAHWIFISNLLKFVFIWEICTVLQRPSFSAHVSHENDISSSRLKRELQVNDSCILDESEHKIWVNTSERLAKLREKMVENHVQAYMVTMNDEHQSEYVAPGDQRVMFISGFSGSAGIAVVTLDKAALWTDGRYFLQAAQQMDCNWKLMERRIGSNSPTIIEWLKTVLKPNDTVGVNSKTIIEEEWNEYGKGLKQIGIDLKGLQADIIDEIWEEKLQARATDKRLLILNITFAGKSWQDKIGQVKETLVKKTADAIIVTALDNVAWLFNLRGNDIPYVPVFKAYAIVSKNFTRLYVRNGVVSEDVENHLNSNNCTNGNCVQLRKYEEIEHDLEEFVPIWNKVWISSHTSHYIASYIPKEKTLSSIIPIAFMQAIKNPTEIQGMKNAHLRDSITLIDFLAMLEEEIINEKPWDEMKAAKVLEEFRSEQKYYQGLSFQTIAASGSNGAIIHYRPAKETNKPITTKELFLLDSGAQYLDGTTDVTRTLHYGNATDVEKEMYTRVLKGAIDMAKLIFPSYLTDGKIDTVARLPLYELGLDYLHGTGHGIGAFLGVHEGPFKITNSLRIFEPELPLREGMFLSDEPGYYKDGQFGIRLETIVHVIKANVQQSFKNISYLTFEPVTWVPFEHKLIKIELLTKDELNWLNEYHSKVKNMTGNVLLNQNRLRAHQWMIEKTKPLAQTD